MTQITALVMSVVIETIVITTWLKKHYESNVRLFATAMTPTLLTHPFLWTSSKYCARLSQIFLAIFALEVLVVFIEALLLRFVCQQLFTRCLLISFVANLSSASVGFLYWYFS